MAEFLFIIILCNTIVVLNFAELPGDDKILVVLSFVSSTLHKLLGSSPAAELSMKLCTTGIFSYVVHISLLTDFTDISIIIIDKIHCST